MTETAQPGKPKICMVWPFITEEGSVPITALEHRCMDLSVHRGQLGSTRKQMQREYVFQGPNTGSSLTTDCVCMETTRP